MICDRDTGRSRGFAFVVMSTPEDAQAAIERYDGSVSDLSHNLPIMHMGTERLELLIESNAESSTISAVFGSALPIPCKGDVRIAAKFLWVQSCFTEASFCSSHFSHDGVLTMEHISCP